MNSNVVSHDDAVPAQCGLKCETDIKQAWRNPLSKCIITTILRIAESTTPATCNPYLTLCLNNAELTYFESGTRYRICGEL
jgi:hypothetical protein